MREVKRAASKIRQNKRRAEGVKNDTTWWVREKHRADSKADAMKMVLAANDGDELKILSGKGVWSGTRAVFDAWCEKYPSVRSEYQRDHGKPLTYSILACRVNNMFYEYDRTRGTKKRCISGEHPDNSPTYELPR